MTAVDVDTSRLASFST